VIGEHLYVVTERQIAGGNVRAGSSNWAKQAIKNEAEPHLGGEIHARIVACIRAVYKGNVARWGALLRAGDGARRGALLLAGNVACRGVLLRAGDVARWSALLRAIHRNRRDGGDHN
jgi:hypothetical protein